MTKARVVESEGVTGEFSVESYDKMMYSLMNKGIWTAPNSVMQPFPQEACWRSVLAPVLLHVTHLLGRRVDPLDQAFRFHNR
jgi:hypothetical protein